VRSRWNTAFLEVFHLRPWELADFTPDEIAAMESVIRKLTKDNRG
jgi:hypothetical protein